MADFLSYELLPVILNLSLTGSVVILCVLLARLALRRAPRIFSYALWMVVLFRLLCPVSLTAGFSLLQLANAPVESAAPHVSVVTYVPQDIVHTPEPQVELPLPAAGDAVTQALPQGEEQTAADPLEAPVSLATVVWLAGVLAMVICGAGSLVRLRRRLVGAVPLAGNIYLADHISSPFVLGLLRPKIYLPSSLPERERDYILLHERHHIRRLDHVVKLLAFLALCVHWFNPLVWLSFVLLGRDMEMSCDEAVLKKLGADVRADYSASLLSLATGRRIIAGAPLAFGEGDTKSRVSNVLRWKQPRRVLVLLAGLACGAVIAACAANPRAEPAGQYASMEDFAREAMSAETVTYFAADGSGASTARVTNRRIARLEKEGEVAGLAPAGTLEAWTFRYEVQLDVPEEAVSLTGVSYAAGGWFDLEGQGGRNLVALRYEDGSCDILYNQPINDNMNFYGYHNSYEEAIHDWYAADQGLDLPLYVADWSSRVTVPVDASSGNLPVHRFDGDGWYLYLPIAGWERTAANPDSAGSQWQWTSSYGTGSTLTVDRFSASLADQQAAARSQGYAPADSSGLVWERREDGAVSSYRLFENPEGGCWRVWTQWSDGEHTGSSDASMELQVLGLMAESFTVDQRITAAADSAALLSAALGSVQEGDPVRITLTNDRGNTISTDSLCWTAENARSSLQGLQGLTWREGGRPHAEESCAVTLACGEDSETAWSLTAYEDGWVRFLAPSGAWDLTADAPDLFSDPYSLLRSWFDEIEYRIESSSDRQDQIVIPNTGQTYLQAAESFAEALERSHLQVSSGSKFRYTFVETHVEAAETPTQLLREDGEIGENTFCFYLTTVFVPENERARQWSWAGNTGVYTGGNPDIPEGALEYGRCGYITLEGDGWHGEIVGTGW